MEWRAAGKTSAGRALGEFPTFTGVFAESDPLALGVLDALEYQGKTVPVVGFDGIPDALLAIRQGRLAATVDQRPRAVGRRAMEAAAGLARGEPVSANLRVDLELVTSTNVVEVMSTVLSLLPATFQDLIEAYKNEQRRQQRMIRHQRHFPEPQRATIRGISPALGERSRRRQELLGEAVSFMRDHLDRPFKIAEVSAALPVSRSYLRNIFVEETGRTPTEFLIDLRIERAMEHIEMRACSVAELAAAVGYASRTYFSRLFKEHTGQTPGAYASRFRASEQSLAKKAHWSRRGDTRGSRIAGSL